MKREVLPTVLSGTLPISGPDCVRGHATDSAPSREPGSVPNRGPDLMPAPDSRPERQPLTVPAALKHRPTGIHVLADLGGIAAEKLCSCEALDALLRAAAEAAHARVLHSHFHGFGDGQGVTGVVLLAESHISIHTWPECGFAAADIFMCGAAQPELALAIVVKALQPSSHSVQSIYRAPPAGPDAGDRLP